MQGIVTIVWQYYMEDIDGVIDDNFIACDFTCPLDGEELLCHYNYVSPKCHYMCINTNGHNNMRNVCIAAIASSMNNLLMLK